MWTHFRRWLDDLPLSDPLVRRQAGMFQIMMLIIIGASLLGLMISSLTSGGRVPSIVALIAYPLLLVSCGSAFALLRRGRFTAAVILGIIGLILAIGLAIIAAGFRNSSNTLLALALPITLAGLIAGRRGLLIAAGSSIG